MLLAVQRFVRRTDDSSAEAALGAAIAVHVDADDDADASSSSAGAQLLGSLGFGA